MRTGVAGVLVTVLAVPSSAVAQRVFDEELGATRPILAAALAAARLEGRPGAASIGAGEAQSGSDVWAQVQTVPAGTRVRVALNDGSEFEGDLVEARADVIVLQNNQLRRGEFRSIAGTSLRDALVFQRANVTSVTVFRGGRFVKPGDEKRPPQTWAGRHTVLTGLLIGASAGAVVGLATGCAIDYGYSCPGINVALLAPIWGGIGALVGLAF